MRRVAALGLLVILAMLGIEWRLVRFPFIDRGPMRRELERYADREWYPYFPQFLEGVRANTKRGDTIALLVPAWTWDSGYSFAYYRASYFLAGRRVLPVVWRDDSRHPEHARGAKYVAAWQVRVDGGEVVWRGSGGTLVKQR